MISIITPTYNRKNMLNNIYKSLLGQKYKDFEWVVIDDGSSDDTEKLIKNLQQEKQIRIKYYYKTNGGKPSAYNLGVEKSSGDILLCLDSDDYLTKDALSIISNDYNKIKDDNTIAGLVYNNIKKIPQEELIGTPLPENVIDTYFNIYKKYNVKGDKTQILKRNIAKEYLFPQIDNEKFVPEALINNRISKKYTFLYRNKAIKIVEYLNDGYSNNYFNLVKNNPKSNALYFQEIYDLEKSIYNIYGYLLFSIFSKYTFRKIIKNHKNKIGIILLYIPTYIIAMIRK